MSRKFRRQRLLPFVLVVIALTAACSLSLAALVHADRRRKGTAVRTPQRRECGRSKPVAECMQA